MNVQLVPPFVVYHMPSWHPEVFPQPLALFGAIELTCA
jgi:hypothetical protein